MKNKHSAFHHVIISTFVLLSICFRICAQVPEPMRFEKAIQKFEQQDAISMPPKGAVLLTGSSSIIRWSRDAHETLPPLTVISRGFGGSNMNDLLHYIDRIAIKYEPRAILIYEGDNDTSLSPPIPKAHILSQLKQIISKVHSTLPNTRFYVLSVKPSIKEKSIWPLALEVNEEFKAFADNEPLVYYIDIASPLLKPDGSVMEDIFVDDNSHLNDKGYQIWARTINEVLVAIEAKYEL